MHKFYVVAVEVIAAYDRTFVEKSFAVEELNGRNALSCLHSARFGEVVGRRDDEFRFVFENLVGNRVKRLSRSSVSKASL